ncbi:MoaD/ThiS family protein [Candidatus Woesearchaeota archaeon]|nr:MoaD/ThiS family protein [Candidatus Woesearchaeota archaeon]
MKVYVERVKEWRESDASSVKALLDEVGVDVESVLVVRNGSLVAGDASLQPEDEVRVLSVISGG